jgi:membrane protease YdiL (CAAX protease family)
VIASTIVFQGFLGVVFGIIFERTRNLIAPSIVHIVLNVFGSL